MSLLKELSLLHLLLQVMDYPKEENRKKMVKASTVPVSSSPSFVYLSGATVHPGHFPLPSIALFSSIELCVHVETEGISCPASGM